MVGGRKGSGDNMFLDIDFFTHESVQTRERTNEPNEVGASGERQGVDR